MVILDRIQDRDRIRSRAPETCASLAGIERLTPNAVDFLVIATVCLLVPISRIANIMSY